MSRLSFRPRPLDIHKKLPIVKSVKDFEDDETPTSTRSSQILRPPQEADNEVQQIPSKKVASEIPTPQYVFVDTYERDYSCTFTQPTSYLRARGARAELGDFVEYDLDNEDEDWLQEFNKEKKLLTTEKFEIILFKLEALDHKARERAGVITATLGSPIPVLLQFDAAAEDNSNFEIIKEARVRVRVRYGYEYEYGTSTSAGTPIRQNSKKVLLPLSVKYGVLQSIYNYWKEKREQWQKPILRRLQPPPPVNDTNPYNVFRPREKAHRLHTRRMQRRENNVQSFEKLRQVSSRSLELLAHVPGLTENNVQSFEKLRQVSSRSLELLAHVPGLTVRRNLDQAKTLVDALIKHETELLEDSLALPGLPSFPGKFGSSEEEFMDSDDVANIRPPYTLPGAVQNMPSMDSKLVMVSAGSMKREFRRKNAPNGWLHKLDPLEPVLLFTKPVDPEKLAAAGIVPPPDSSTTTMTTMTMMNSASGRSYNFHGRIGRGGRIVFDRWNPLMHTPIDCGFMEHLPEEVPLLIYPHRAYSIWAHPVVRVGRSYHLAEDALLRRDGQHALQAIGEIRDLLYEAVQHAHRGDRLHFGHYGVQGVTVALDTSVPSTSVPSTSAPATSGPSTSVTLPHATPLISPDSLHVHPIQHIRRPYVADPDWTPP
ncbi:hypothetical protein TEA_001113 [Camellia sinensis var. sinensis]|uniref:Enhancer of polycomb-like protein n=1 Tax=Camellia sinensis var. sinensis TaxID=542762 RepID=A0A4S4DAZ0_CAMSN|nr:hypothetical protein TEA_001113 [Camellia sinensis var. sinensis]